MNGRCRAAVLFLASFAPLACTARAAGSTAVPKKVATVEGITEYRLENGLRVLLFPDASKPTVTVNLTVLVGSRHEGYGETGMAHLLEHMLFKGTPAHPDVPRALRRHGAEHAYNGTTWVDRTNYYETMPAKDENLEFGIGLEADRLVNSYVRKKDLDTEMTVVRNEFEAGENSPDRVLSERLLSAAYEWHNYGKSTIGNRTDIERVPIDRLQAFYHKYYQPDNAVLIVAGRFDPAKALDSVAKYFGALKRPERQLPTTYTEEPPQDGERTVILRRVGSVGAVGAVYHIPAAAHGDFAALEILNHILVDEPSGRLYQVLVQAKRATSVSGQAHGYHDPGVLELIVRGDKGVQLVEILDTLIGVAERSAREKPFTTEEVDRAKARLLKDREKLMEQADQVAVALSEWISKGDWRLFFLHRDRLEQVTPADVNRVAGRYLVRSNRTAGMFVPTAANEIARADIPETPSAAKLVQDYKGRKALVQGEAFEATPEHIEKRVKRSTLPGGIKVALLPKKTRGQAVVLHLNLRYGNEESLKEHTTAAAILPALMTRGTKRHTRRQLQDELDRLGARLGASGGTGVAGFTLRAKRATFPDALRLLREVLREPSLAPAELEVLKRERREALSRGSTDPGFRAFRTLQRRLDPYPKDDVRYEPTIGEAIDRVEAVSAEEVQALYAEQLQARAGEAAVVGDFDPDEAVRLLGEALADWRSSVPYRHVPRLAHADVEGGREVIPTPDKPNAVYVAGESQAMNDADPDYPALEIGNFILGGGTLSSRLGTRVRQKEGLSYGVGSQFNADARDEAARFMIFAICNPKNMEKAERAIGEELATLLKDGVRDDELAEAKNAYLEREKVQLAEDGTLAVLLAHELFNGRTFTYYAELEKKIAALGPGEVTAALRRRIDPKRLVIVEAGDFRKKEDGKDKK